MWQRPLSQGNSLKSISFSDKNEGWAVGYTTLMKNSKGKCFFFDNLIDDALLSVFALQNNNVWVTWQWGNINY
ncbi:MAG: hypothetical protein KA792_03200 [Bacteroidales bacterium]|nr:hypothetical protein [Bacteroidales bacterium]